MPERGTGAAGRQPGAACVLGCHLRNRLGGLLVQVFTLDVGYGSVKKMVQVLAEATGAEGVHVRMLA